MSKSDRISDFVQKLGPTTSGLDACYQGFFQCFNARLYYQAHDVLEHLWLKQRDANYAFYKGLIQLAGAYVHLQKQSLRPLHPKDGRRLHPAARLFRMAATNLEPYGPRHFGLDVEAVCALCREQAHQIEDSGFTRNPWSPENPPQLHLQL